LVLAKVYKGLLDLSACRQTHAIAIVILSVRLSVHLSVTLMTHT